MKLYIIRHGETGWNKSLRLQGQTDIALNDNGRLLAQVTARALQNVSFDFCITSPLIRAKETAQIVLDGRPVSIFEDERIQEIGFGTYEGKRVKNEIGVITDPVFENFFHRPAAYQPPKGGETLQEFCARVASFLKELAENPDFAQKTILISTHGAASRAMLTVIKQHDMADFWDVGVPPNCAVTIAEYDANPNLQTCHSSTNAAPCWVIKEQDTIYYENS